MTDTITPTSADTIIRHQLTAIVPNRYQRRHIDPAAQDIAELAANIREHGLQNPVIGRWSPGADFVVELVSGHRRTAAFTLLAKTDPAYATIPLIVRSLTDRQMFEACAIENAHRRDLSAIEKATSLRDYLAEFKVGQAEAGALFGIGQAAVSHLLRLLKLPTEVQALVDSRDMAERTARALVPLVEWRPDVVVKIALGAMKAPADERDEVVENAVERALRDLAPSLGEYNTAWPLEWPAKPLPVPGFKSEKGEPAEVPACKGCRFNLARDRQNYCLRPPCHAAKSKLWPAQAVAAASKALGIPAGAPGEKVVVIWDGGGNYDRRGQMVKAVRAKRPELRLVPNPTPPTYSAHDLKDVTGSKFVLLAATSKAAIDDWLGETKGKTVKAPVPANETPAQRERRINAERELAEERAAERSAYNKAKADGVYLFDRAAHLIADNTVAAGGLLAWAALHPNVLSAQVIELNDARRALESAAQLGRDSRTERDRKPAPATPELDHIRRKYIAYTEMVKKVAAYQAPTQLFSKFGEMVRGLAKHAEAAFAVTLPAGWDTVPVHKTAANCWECGAFAGNPKGFTKAELAEGWGGDAKAGYHCPVHAPSKRLVSVFADQPTPALESNVRGHAPLRPAPKPSAALKPAGVSTGKPTRRAAQRAQAAAPKSKPGKGGRK